MRCNIWAEMFSVFVRNPWIQRRHCHDTLCAPVSPRPGWFRWAGHGPQVGTRSRLAPFVAPLQISGLTSETSSRVSQFCRFAKEYSASPSRGYGSGVIQVLKKLSSPQIKDVYQPARDQFNGRGSFGNGGAMRAAPFALAFPDLADVKKVRSRLNTALKTNRWHERTFELSDCHAFFLYFSSAVCPSWCHADTLLLSGI